MNVEASGDASDIRAKYQQPAPAKSESTVSIDQEDSNKDVFDRMQEKLENKSKITKRTYKFEGQISQCFEPYL